jgi:hypothetical protein
MLRKSGIDATGAVHQVIKTIKSERRKDGI